MVILTDLRQGIFTRIKSQELWKTEFKCIWLRCMLTSVFNCKWLEPWSISKYPWERKAPYLSTNIAVNNVLNENLRSRGNNRWALILFVAYLYSAGSDWWVSSSILYCNFSSLHIILHVDMDLASLVFPFHPQVCIQYTCAPTCFSVLSWWGCVCVVSRPVAEADTWS